MQDRKVIAIGFLTHEDLERLGTGFRRHFAIQDAADFDDLVAKLDDIDLSAPRMLGPERAN